MKIMNLKKIGEKIVETMNKIEDEREHTREQFERTQERGAFERMIFLDGKISGIEEIFRILQGQIK